MLRSSVTPPLDEKAGVRQLIEGWRRVGDDGGVETERSPDLRAMSFDLAAAPIVGLQRINGTTLRVPFCDAAGLVRR
jgi:hypothetical protein